MFLFTDFVPTVETQVYYGWVFVSLVCAMTLVNVLVLAINQCYTAFKKARIAYLRRLNKNRLSKRGGRNFRKVRKNLLGKFAASAKKAAVSVFDNKSEESLSDGEQEEVLTEKAKVW
jgi:hypothetical protein